MAKSTNTTKATSKAMPMIVTNNAPKRRGRPAMVKTEQAVAEGTADPSHAQVLEWWPTGGRGEAIVAMMKGGLPYFRAVKRSRRYYMNGKLV